MHGNRGHWDLYISFDKCWIFARYYHARKGDWTDFCGLWHRNYIPRKWRRYDHQDTAPSAGARHPLPRVRYCAFRTRRGIIYHRTTITLMISLMYKIENRWPSVIPQLLKVSVSDHTSGKHVNDRPDLLLSHTGIAHAFFIYLTLIYSSNMLHNDKEKYWELVEVLPAFRIRLNKL